MLVVTIILLIVVFAVFIISFGLPYSLLVMSEKILKQQQKLLKYLSADYVSEADKLELKESLSRKHYWQSKDVGYSEY